MRSTSSGRAIHPHYALSSENTRSSVIIAAVIATSRIQGLLDYQRLAQIWTTASRLSGVGPYVYHDGASVWRHAIVPFLVASLDFWLAASHACGHENPEA